MLEINFIYKGQNYLIQYQELTKVKEAFEEFANKNFLKIEELIFFYKEIKVNLNLDLSIQQQFDLEKDIKIGNNNEKMLEILVFNKAPFKNNLTENDVNINLNDDEDAFEKIKNIEINFIYKNKDNIFQTNSSISLKKICTNFSEQNFLDIKYLIFIYNGIQIDITSDNSILKQLKSESEYIKDIQRIDLLVFEDFYQVIFSFGKIPIPPLDVKETIQIKELINKFEEITKLKKEDFSFIYNTNFIKEPSKVNSNEKKPGEENIWDKSMIDIMNQMDKKKKSITIIVYENNDDISVNTRSIEKKDGEEVLIEDIIKVKILNRPYNITINAKKDDKLKDIILLFAEKADKSQEDLEKILFIYKKGIYSLNNINEKTLIDIATHSDISNKEMIFAITNIIKEEQPYPDENREIDNNLNENLLVKGELYNEYHKSYKFYVWNFFILAIQYFSIIITLTLCFIFKANEIFHFRYNYILYIILFIIVFVFSFVIHELSDKSNKNIIYYIITYPVIIIIFSLLLSQYLEYKYIIIGLSLIFLENLSQAIYVIIFKKYKLLFFGISSSVLSLIGIILFSAFWIKDLLPIIYVSIFYLCTIGYNLLFTYITLQYCKSNEYYFSITIFNYGIFLSMAYGIKSFFISIIISSEEFNYEDSLIKVFIVLIIQYIVIIIPLWIIFSNDFFDKINNVNEPDLSLFHSAFWPPSGLSLIICLVFLCYIDDEPNNCNGFIFCHIIYVPIMISYYFSFSLVIEYKYILCFMFIIFIDLLIIIILILLFRTEKIGYIFVFCFIIDIIAILLFHFLWLKSTKAIIAIPILSFGIIIYLIILSILAKDKYNGDLHLSLFIIDYGFFFLVYFMVLLVLYLICLLAGLVCENL